MAAPVYPTNFGSGTGFIYITQLDGTTVTTSFRNDTTGRANAISAFASIASTTASLISYDATFRLEGSRIFYADSALAIEGVVYVDSTEITSYLTGGRADANITQQATISSGVITLNRYASKMVVTIDTEGGAPTDILDTITMSGAIQGDELTIYGLSSARVITIPDNTGNIRTPGSVSWTSGGIVNKIVLTYNILPGTVTNWYETSRSAESLFPTVDNLRDFSTPVPIAGAGSTVLTNAGATTTLTPGTDKGYQVYTGSAALAAPVTITFDPLGGKDGDTFTIDYRATLTVGAFAVTLGGITLTDAQALAGNVMVTGLWDAFSGSWKSVLYQKANGVDLLSSAQAASTYEPALGLPANDGYTLTSDTAGVRSWTPLNNPILENVTANTETTAIITEEILKTYTLPGGMLDTDGDQLEIIAIYQTAANANVKTITLKFGATTLGTTGAVAYNATTIVVRAVVNRVDGTNQSAICTISTSTGVVFVAYTTPGETLSADLDIQMCATNGVASAGDIIARSWSIRKFDN